MQEACWKVPMGSILVGEKVKDGFGQRQELIAQGALELRWLFKFILLWDKGVEPLHIHIHPIEVTG